MNDAMHWAETAAADMARETGCTIEQARVGLRIEIIKCRVGIGALSIDAANRELAEYGVQLRRPA